MFYFRFAFVSLCRSKLSLLHSYGSSQSKMINFFFYQYGDSQSKMNFTTIFVVQYIYEQEECYSQYNEDHYPSRYCFHNGQIREIRDNIVAEIRLLCKDDDIALYTSKLNYLFNTKWAKTTLHIPMDGLNEYTVKRELNRFHLKSKELFDIFLTFTQYRRYIPSDLNVQNPNKRQKKRARNSCDSGYDIYLEHQKCVAVGSSEFDARQQEEAFFASPVVDRMNIDISSCNQEIKAKDSATNVVLTCEDIDQLSLLSKRILFDALEQWQTALHMPLSPIEVMATIMYHFFPNKAFQWIQYDRDQNISSVTRIFPELCTDRAGQVYYTFPFRATSFVSALVNSTLVQHLHATIQHSSRRISIREIEEWQESMIDHQSVWQSDTQLAEWLEKECNVSVLLGLNVLQLQKFVCTVSLHRYPWNGFNLNHYIFLLRAVRPVPSLYWSDTSNASPDTRFARLLLRTKEEQKALLEHRYVSNAHNKFLVLIYPHVDEFTTVKRENWKKHEEWLVFDEMVNYICDSTDLKKVLEQCVSTVFKYLPRSVPRSYTSQAYCLNQLQGIYQFGLDDDSCEWWIPKYAIDSVLGILQRHCPKSVSYTHLRAH